MVPSTLWTRCATLRRMASLRPAATASSRVEYGPSRLPSPSMRSRHLPSSWNVSTSPLGNDPLLRTVLSLSAEASTRPPTRNALRDLGSRRAFWFRHEFGSPNPPRRTYTLNLRAAPQIHPKGDRLRLAQGCAFEAEGPDGVPLIGVSRGRWERPPDAVEWGANAVGSVCGDGSVHRGRNGV